MGRQAASGAGGLHKMHSVASLTGISPELLRAWERRYGLLAPVRTAGGHRLYTEDDVQVLRRVRKELARGRSIGELAATGRDALLGRASPRAEGGGEATTGALLERLRAELVRGAVELDAPRLDRALDQAYAAASPGVVAHQLLRPAAYDIGDAWARGECSIAGEHLASAAFARRLIHQLETAERATSSGPLALVTAAPDEQHTLGALMLAADLARRGTPVRYFGAALPAEALERAVRALSPAEVYVSFTVRDLFRVHGPSIAALARRWPNTLFHVGGQGVPDQPLPSAPGNLVVLPLGRDPESVQD